MVTEVINNTGSELSSLYSEFISYFPEHVGIFINFLILVLLVVIYSILIWKYSKFISKKNPLGLDLGKHTREKESFFMKAITGLLYFLEYIIILPFLIFIVFSVFTLLIILLIQIQNVNQILMITAIIIASVRVAAYYKESISRDIVKLLPFNLLAVLLLNPNTFSQTNQIGMIIDNFSKIPDVFGNIIYYLIYIIILEIILRFFDYIFSLFELEEEEEEKKD